MSLLKIERDLAEIRASAKNQQEAVLFIKFIAFYKKHPVSPPSQLVNTDAWLQDPDLCLKRADHKSVKAVCHLWSLMTARWTTADFRAFYTSPECEPAFIAVSASVSKTYYGLDESVHHVSELLMFQFGGKIDDVVEFLTTLANILEKLDPEINCLAVVSGPSARKNWYFDAIRDFYGNCGEVGGINNLGRLFYQDMHLRRLAFWHQTSIDTKDKQKLKMVLSGKPIEAHQRSGGVVIVPRTPVIIITDDFNMAILSDENFKSCIKKYTWKPAPQLKLLDKKPYPLMFPYLLERFGVNFSGAM